MASNLLSLLIFLPLAALVIINLPGVRKEYTRYIAGASVLIQFLISLLLFLQYNADEGAGINEIAGFQAPVRYNWIYFSLGDYGHLSAEYFLGIDGINVSLVFLSGIILVVALGASWNIKENARAYFSLFVLLSASLMGCFLALDFLLFYVFFEFMLLPMYFLIGMWGGPRRGYASIKFFLYTLLGSLLILVVMIALYSSVIDPASTAKELGLVQEYAQVNEDVVAKVQAMLDMGSIESRDLVHTFNMVYMTDADNFIPGSLMHWTNEHVLFGLSPRIIAFLVLFLGFAIKLPSVPLHTWLPDAHVEAPTPVSVLLAGILLKIGGYGILRIAYPVFPEGAHYFSWFIGFLGLLSIVYGAFAALAQHDLKRMVAYSSISHMGFVLLGIASLTEEGVNGAVFQMFSHGILSAGLFLIAGIIQNRTGDRTIDHYSGLASKMPFYATLVTILFFASLGLPGFSAFIAEIFVLLGAFRTDTFLPNWMPVAATSGLILGAAYFLWTMQRMFFGRFRVWKPEWESSFKDLTNFEVMLLLPLVLLTLLFGIFPNLFFDVVSPSAGKLVHIVVEEGEQFLKGINF